MLSQSVPENPEKLKSKRASSGSMVSKQIIQFKCVVIRCDQDFGAFCRERGLGKKKRFVQQPGATKPAPDWDLGMLVEVDGGFGGVEWMPWVLRAIMEVGGWWCELRSLVGQLLWDWEFWCCSAWTSCGRMAPHRA